MAITEAVKEMEQGEAVVKKYRVQLDFTPADFETLNRLTRELGLGTRAELFRSSVLALQWMVQKKEQGYSVVATNFDGRYFEPEFGFLRHVQPVEPVGASRRTAGEAGGVQPGTTQT